MLSVKSILNAVTVASFVLVSSSLYAQDKTEKTEAADKPAETEIEKSISEATEKAAEISPDKLLPPDAQDPENESKVPEAGTTDEDTPVVLEEIAGDKDLTGARPWRAPDFSKQENALGWTPDAFAVPKGLEVNVQFWLDIYTKYTTDQGLLHDAEYIDLIYETLDFTHISSRTDISLVQKSLLRSKAVKEGKRRIVAMLKKLKTVKDPAGLDDNEKRVWDYFQKVEGKNKFIDATKANRLRFQLGQRDRMIQGIFFSGRYLEDFENIFREAGIPIELTRLPFVESSFNVLARSKVGASGLWQIMRVTSKPYMKVNDEVDRRNYPPAAAKLAAHLFKINYNMLQAWPLAVTGYNHGPAGVQKLVKTYHSRELGTLILGKAKRHLGFASRNFYASFLAALEAESHAPKYFGPTYWSKPLLGAEIKLGRAVKWPEIVQWFDGNDQVAQIYNPHVTTQARKHSIPLSKGTQVYVPVAKKDEIEESLKVVPEPPKKKKKRHS